MSTNRGTSSKDLGHRSGQAESNQDRAPRHRTRARRSISLGCSVSELCRTGSRGGRQRQRGRDTGRVRHLRRHGRSSSQRNLSCESHPSAARRVISARHSSCGMKLPM